MLTLQQFTFNPFSENTYILYSDKGNAFLIDPGCSTHSEEQQLKTFIAEKGLTIEKILLTHAHIDHVFGLQWACDTYALPVHLHPYEKEVLERNPSDARLFGFTFPEFDGQIVEIDTDTILYIDDTPLPYALCQDILQGVSPFMWRERRLSSQGMLFLEEV